MKVEWRPAARKAFLRLPAADQTAIQDKLERYVETGAGDVTRLVGATALRLRHRDWRVIFEVEDGILVVRVAHRSVAYRQR